MITPQLLSMLWCPSCRSGGLIGSPEQSRSGESARTLRCRTCHAVFPVLHGVPTLIPRDAMTGEEWREWKRHLDKFQARRQARRDEPDRAINRIAEKSRPQPPFAHFTDISEGVVLDVGCGPGTFRKHFDPKRVRYVGLDPIALPEADDFPFVQGVGEFLPFRDDVFTDVVVLAALDHFRDVGRFLDEARRVLQGGGRLHVMQSVYELRGPVSVVKLLTHWIKDSLEEHHSSGYDRNVPKHLSEYSTHGLVRDLGRNFKVSAMERYDATWYSPTKVFLSFVPKQSAAGTAVRSTA
jgi:SAM-dependent methyltransferase